MSNAGDQLEAGFKRYRESPPEGHAVFLDFDEYAAEQASVEPTFVGIEDPEAIAMAMTIERPITGDQADTSGYVVLQDGRAFACTWREWGAIMAERFGGSYLDYYMGEVRQP